MPPGNSGVDKNSRLAHPKMINLATYQYESRFYRDHNTSVSFGEITVIRSLLRKFI